jgi:hypothetical protein
MSQPNQKVWHLRVAENPRNKGESPFEYYRRMAVKYGCSFENARHKINKHLKQIRLDEVNEKGYIPVIDKEGIDYGEVSHGWLKTTKADSNGHKHSLFFKVGHEGDFIGNLAESLKGYQFCALNLGKKIVSNSIGLINLFDAHIDKVCIVDNTHTNSSIESNIEHFKRAFVALFSKCLLAEKIVFPIGNDFFNANDEKNTTVKGTPQDSLFDWKDSFSKGVELIRWCVDYMLQAGKPVDLITVYSNHDATKLFYLSKCIELIYAGNENVTIDLQGVQRKYSIYGANLFGFAHGDKEKTAALPLLMATERRKDWGNVSNCFWFLGDKHHEKTFMFKKSLDMPSVEVHWLRAVATSDNWHYQSGYIGIPKTAYCYIFDIKHGLTTTHRQPF